MRINKIFYIVFFFVFSIKCEDNIPEKPKKSKSIFDKAKKENLLAFIKQDEEQQVPEDDDASYLQRVYNKELNFDKTDKRELAFEILKIYEKNNSKKIAYNDILDDVTSQNLNILNGPISDPAVYLAEKVDRATTEVGKAFLATMIFNPTSNVQGLVNRQNVIKNLTYNKKLFERINNVLKKLEKDETIENLALSFVTNDAFQNMAEQKKALPSEMENLFPNEDWNYNYNSLWMEGHERLYESIELLFGVASLFGIPILTISALLSLFGAKNKAFAMENFAQRWFHSGVGIAAFTPVGLLSGANNNPNMNRFVHVANNLSAVLLYVTALLPNALRFVQSSKIFYELSRKKLKSLVQFINIAKEIDAIILENPELQKGLKIDKSFLKVKSATIDKLLNVLSTEDFRLFDFDDESTIESWVSWFFTYKGALLKAFYLIEKNRNFLAQMFTEVGQVDAYMSIAKLYKEGEHSENNWVFPIYKEISQNKEKVPSLEIKEFWNPFIDSKEAISNSLSMGLNQPGAIVITGPNAAGKSTAIKGVLINIILAQTIGIAPATYLCLTPFTKMMTYLNIIDDIINGQSHFKAGVDRAKEILSTVSELDKNEFAFLTLDEVFSGTSFFEGQAAAYSLIEKIGKTPATLSITATHFSLLTNLAKKDSKNFMNYKVSADLSSGNISYPFKLEPGISIQHIAFNILQEEGFDDDFINRASEILTEEEQGKTCSSST